MLLLFLLFFLAGPPLTLSLNQEGLYLQSLKRSLEDPDAALSSWNERDDTPCNWHGVSCDPASHSVTYLELSSANVGGPFSNLLCHLPNLLFISFFNNSINSTLPSDLSACGSLQNLDLSENLLTGLLPSTLANLPNLVYLDLTGNNLSGGIPDAFGRFQKLEVLSLVFNLLDDTIPAMLGNIILRVRKDSENDDVEKGPVQDNVFDTEVETLGKIRHKNIVKLCCYCVTRDCKLLVYEYMPNGSLGDLLHGSRRGLLDWPTRYKIALDTAECLSNLRHDCVPPIVHRDVKSNNILLDGDFRARVSDFGVAKMVDSTGKGPKSMSVIAGSCGYIAPEYAYTLRVNEKSDIYSFAVVILELVTGRLPVDPEYGENDLLKWVCTSLDQKSVDHVIDAKLDSCYKEEICKVLNLGLSPLPINRPAMRRVVKLLQELGSESKSKMAKKDGKLSPYYYEDASDQGSVA